MTEPCITLDHVTKKYRIRDRNSEISFWEKMLCFFHPKYQFVYGVKDISFSITQGEFVGLIGENGAGKSTLIKLMTSILTPTEGSITVLGYTPYKDRKKYTPNIGVVMGQKSLLWFNIPVIESLKLYKEIYKVSNEQFSERINFYRTIFDADDILPKAVRQLSLGQRMRAELMASLLHKPEILFLDEPTIGLDVISKNALQNHLKEINERDGTTIILTSHDSNEVEKLCKRIIILHEGEILHDKPIIELLKSGNDTISLESYLLNLYKTLGQNL